MEIRKLVGQKGYAILDEGEALGFANTKKEARQILNELRCDDERHDYTGAADAVGLAQRNYLA